MAPPVLPKPRKSSHPVDVGLRTEGAILHELHRRGYDVLVPIGFNRRYDLVIDCEGQLLKVQCKTGRLRGGAIEFRAVSTQSNMNRTRVRGYSGQVDLFIVYCPETEKTYVIPAEDVPGSRMYLRVAPPRNRQAKRVRWAKEYELPA